MKKILDEFKRLTQEEKKLIIFNLLHDGDISFADVSKLYVKVLETQKADAERRESLFANCLLSYVSKSAFKKRERAFFQSQAYVLCNKWWDNTIIKKYLPERNEELIKRNEGFIK